MGARVGAVNEIFIFLLEKRLQDNICNDKFPQQGIHVHDVIFFRERKYLNSYIILRYGETCSQNDKQA